NITGAERSGTLSGVATAAALRCSPSRLASMTVSAPRSSAPAVVVADADAFLLGLVCRHLVAEPAFPEQDGAGARGDVHEVPVLRSRFSFARRGRHHEAEARILEADRARPRRDDDVIG